MEPELPAIPPNSPLNPLPNKAANKAPDGAADLATALIPARNAGRLVVLGAGTIGELLGYQAALGGHPVTVIDVSENASKRADASVDRALEREAATAEERDAIRGRIEFRTGDIAVDETLQRLLAEAAFVIEALPEKKELKTALLGTLDGLVPPHIPIVTVSSSFPVGELVEEAVHRDRFINAHPLQRGIAAIEVMPSEATQPQITDAVGTLFHGIGMVPIPVLQENVGFIFNIAWRNIKKTALDLVARGVNTPEDFDRIWMMAFKTEIGPFGVMDLVGLDVVVDIERRYAALTGRADDAPPQFLCDMVDRNELGIKSGRGFYSYTEGLPVYRRPGFLELGSNVVGMEGIVPIRDTLIGAWELVSFTARKAGSDEILYPMGRDVGGMLMYLPSGQMAVMIEQGDRPPLATNDPLAGTLEERARAFSQSFYYRGTFRYGNGVVFHDVKKCSFANWDGLTLVRNAALDADGQLVLSTPPVEVGGNIGMQTLVWRKLRASR